MRQRVLTRLGIFRQEKRIAPSSRFFQKYRPDLTRWRVDFFLSVFPRRKSGKNDCSRHGNLPDIGFCDLSIGKTDCLRNGLSPSTIVAVLLHKLSTNLDCAYSMPPCCLHMFNARTTVDAAHRLLHRNFLAMFSF